MTLAKQDSALRNRISESGLSKSLGRMSLAAAANANGRENYRKRQGEVVAQV